VPESIDVLDLPIQLFALGTAVGMASALAHHHKTGDMDHWPVHLAYFALGFFSLGLLVSLVIALF
jgi:hypothetical protein